MRTQTKETQHKLTSEKALEILTGGNKRCVNNMKADRDLLKQVNGTGAGQHRQQNTKVLFRQVITHRRTLFRIRQELTSHRAVPLH